MSRSRKSFRVGSLGVRPEQTGKEFYYKSELDVINSELRVLARQTANQFWAQRPVWNKQLQQDFNH